MRYGENRRRYYNTVAPSVVPLDRRDGSSPLDLATKEGARDTCQRLDAYWHSKGYPLAKHVVIRVGTFSNVVMFGTRSNLVNGIPPRTAAEARAREEMLVGAE
jgi:hypothetical protein